MQPPGTQAGLGEFCCGPPHQLCRVAALAGCKVVPNEELCLLPARVASVVAIEARIPAGGTHKEHRAEGKGSRVRATALKGQQPQNMLWAHFTHTRHAQNQETMGTAQHAWHLLAEVVAPVEAAWRPIGVLKVDDSHHFALAVCGCAPVIAAVAAAAARSAAATNCLCCCAIGGLTVYGHHDVACDGDGALSHGHSTVTSTPPRHPTIQLSTAHPPS